MNVLDNMAKTCNLNSLNFTLTEAFCRQLWIYYYYYY